MKAILMVKGFDYSAKKSQIRIYRDSEKEILDIIKVDYT
jgi:hypothetical protein